MRGRFSGLVLAILVAFSLTSVMVHSAGPRTPVAIYVQLSSPVNTSCCLQQEYPLITANFTTPTATQATILVTVTVFGCCPGAFAEQLAIDNGPLHQIGGGDTSRSAGIRETLTTFERVSFGPGPHMVTMAVYNGGGTWTIDSGPLTTILIEFN